MKKLSICPLGKVWVYCLKSLKKPSIYPLGKTPSAPSGRSLIALDPNSEITQWPSRFLELKDADIRGPGRDEDNEPSEGRTVSSWIWLVPKPSLPLETPRPDTNTNTDIPSDDLSTGAASGEEVAVSIRAHWARCQARAERYEEEVELTVEEMRRTLEFFKWKSHWWLTL